MLEEFLGSHELKLGPVGVKILFCNLFAGGGGGGHIIECQILLWNRSNFGKMLLAPRPLNMLCVISMIATSSFLYFVCCNFSSSSYLFRRIFI